MTAISPLPEVPDQQTTAVTIAHLRDAGVLGDCYADFGLVLDGRDVDADFDRYESIGRFLAASHDAARWWIADWLTFGEGAFGERFFQAAEATGLSESTLVDYARVSLRVPRSRRRSDLHFSHHREVAKLDPDAQEYWLQRAADRSLSTRELREEIEAQNPRKDDDSGGGSDDRSDVLMVRVERRILAAIVAEAREADDPSLRLVPNELIVQVQAAIGDES